MANFTIGDIGGTEGVPIRVDKPEETNTAGSVLGIVGGLLEAGSSIFAAGSRAEGQRVSDTTLTSHSSELLKVAEAVKQGVYSSGVGRSRSRSITNQAITNNPALSGDIRKAHAQIINTAGLGLVVREGTQEEQNRLALEKSALEDAWISPTSTQQEKDIGVLQFLRDKAHSRQLASVERDLSLKQSQVNLSKSIIEANNASARSDARAALQGIAGTQTFRFKQSMDQLLTRVAGGGLTEGDATELAKQQWAVVVNTVNTTGSGAGGDFIGNLTRPMELIFNNTIDSLSPDKKRLRVQEENDLMLALAESQFLSDPVLAASAAASKLLPNTDLLSMKLTDSRVAAILAKNSAEEGNGANVIATTEEEKKSVGVYLKHITNNMKRLDNGTANDVEEVTRQLNTQLENSFKNFDAYALAIESPSDLNQIVGFLSSPSFGKYSESQGGLPKGLSSKIAGVLKEQYENVVVPKVTEDFNSRVVNPTSKLIIDPSFGLAPQGLGLPTATATKGKEEPLSKFVKPVFGSGGMSFVVEGQTNANISSQTKRLNELVAPIINNLIRTGAHLQGHRDYKRVFDENFTGIFGIDKSPEPGEEL